MPGVLVTAADEDGTPIVTASVCVRASEAAWSGNDYLRKGTDGEARGTTFTVTSAAGTTTLPITHSAAGCNGGSTGTRPAAG